MSMKEKKALFEQTFHTESAAILTFHGTEGMDVYNCSVPFTMHGHRYIYGRVENRKEWATSWVCLFEETGMDDWTRVPESMIYQLEDPYIQFFGDYRCRTDGSAFSHVPGTRKSRKSMVPVP